MVEIRVDQQRRYSKAAKILDMIEAQGGMTFTQIQRALWAMTYPDVPFSRKQRGWWCTALYGGDHYGPGLLRFFCEKVRQRWVRRADVSHNGKPWKAMRQ